MFNNPIVQIALALLFVFLVMAALVSLVQQAIVQGLRLRARNLRHSIFRLLSDDVYGDEIAKRFYRHPMTAALSGGKSEATCMEPLTFVTALASAVQPSWSTGDAIDTLPASVAALKEGELKRRLSLVMPPPGAERKLIVEGVTAWFATAEQKMGERFKADSIGLSYGVAALATILLNVSAVEIVQRLRSDDQLRVAFASVAPDLAPIVYDRSETAMAVLGARAAQGEDAPVAQTQAPAAEGQAQVEAAVTTTSLSMQDTGALLTIFECARGHSDLPIGWAWMAEVTKRLRGAVGSTDACAEAIAAVPEGSTLAQSLASFQERAPIGAVGALNVDAEHHYGPTFERNGIAEVLLGWLITVIAAAQGAPFWFNAIRRIVGR